MKCVHFACITSLERLSSNPKLFLFRAILSLLNFSWEQTQLKEGPAGDLMWLSIYEYLINGHRQSIPSALWVDFNRRQSAQIIYFTNSADDGKFILEVKKEWKIFIVRFMSHPHHIKSWTFNQPFKRRCAVEIFISIFADFFLC